MKQAQFEVQAEKLSKEELEAIVEFKGSVAFKVFSKFQESQSQSLKDQALCLNDLNVTIRVGDQEYLQKIPVKEQLVEMQGRQNQMIAERSFINAVVVRHNKMLAQKQIKKKKV